jgi:hypothetical protein
MKIKLPPAPDTKDFNETLKRHKIEKKLRKEILRLDEDEVQIKALREDVEEKVKKLDELQQNHEKKKKMLQELALKGKARQEELIKKKAVLEESTVKGKPKYVEMEEFFKANFEVPELQRRKDELAKKRNLYQPLSRQDWLEHMKKYKELALDAEKKRIKKLEEKSTERVNIINRAKRELEFETENFKKHKKSMKEKMKRYSEVVRDIFAPRVELKDPSSHSKPSDSPLKEPSKSPLKPSKVSKTENPLQSRSFQVSISKSPDQLPLSSSPTKALHLTPHPKSSKTPDIKKPVAVFDYLASKRKERDSASPSSFSIPSLSSVSQFERDSGHSSISQLQKMEKILYQNIQKLKDSDITSASVLQYEEELNDFIAASIRAKLSYLV